MLPFVPTVFVYLMCDLWCGSESLRDTGCPLPSREESSTAEGAEGAREGRGPPTREDQRVPVDVGYRVGRVGRVARYKGLVTRGLLGDNGTGKLTRATTRATWSALGSAFTACALVIER